jgi:hypothetical protein
MQYVFPLAFLVLSCKGCLACFTPSVPHPDETEDTGEETGETGDSAVDTAVVDTAPPPPCDTPEVEPNGIGDDPTPVAMEDWACGTLGTDLDLDRLEFTVDGPIDWLRLDFVAAQEGSAAHIGPALLTDDGTYDCDVVNSDVHSPYTDDPNDPVIAFPILEAPHTFVVTIGDVDWQKGKEDYHWKFRARSEKAPVSWTTTEVDTGYNGAAIPLAAGDRVFGRFSSASDSDPYTIEIPAAPKGGHVRLTVDTDGYRFGYRFGSPAEAKFSIVTPSGVYKKTNYHKDEYGRTSDCDPYYTFYADEAGTWTVIVQPRGSGGSMADWYVLGLTTEILEG